MPSRSGGPAATTLAAVPGAAVGAAFGLAARLRRSKPLHPVGQVGTGTLQVTDPLPDLGVPLLARTGEHRCLARWSRSTGLPAPLPDIEGLALRLEDEGADLLFSGTGTGPTSRFLLAPRRPRHHGPQGTILPLQTDAGPVLMLATPVAGKEDEPPRRFVLSAALGRGPWAGFGVLEVSGWGPDQPVRFDPVRHMLRGTRQYPVVRVLREPAYLAARRGSPADPSRTDTSTRVG